MKLVCLLVLYFWLLDHGIHVSEHLIAEQAFDSGIEEL
jgi:hypothetical protein